MTRLTYSEMADALTKRAYHFNDWKHPDNRTANTIAGGVAGAAIGGGGAYLLAKLLKAKNAWAYGLGGAAAGIAGGAYAGNALTDRKVDWDAYIRARQDLSDKEDAELNALNESWSREREAFGNTWLAQGRLWIKLTHDKIDRARGGDEVGKNI